MVFDLIVPELEKKGNVKDFIIGILIENWPLTLKEIYSSVKKNYHFSGSYQAIFKSVNELLVKKVLIKKGKEYEINISWIKRLQSFTDIVETNYYAEKKAKEDIRGKSEDTLIMNFSSVFDMEKYLYYFIKNELKKLKNKKVVYEMNHLWKALFYYRAEYNYYTKLSKLGHKFYFFVEGKSKIEEEAKKFYRKIGVKVFQGKDSLMDKIIFGEYYMEILIPDLLRRKIQNFLKEDKSFEVLKLLDGESPVQIILHKNKALAEELIKKYKIK